ncbi:hypothetical protein KAFR_0C02390 [Kazachstania africana CBS 2517]|uniref:Programmed cell death protein 2 C-terminal domain-containing protein n=1 Tax=Kazachstania africana (strain ATCC 22294 / BCRC 22015 / CBS 2517 / CECT 1963 / NBRC 1671 / NRRL Y-8276) TaxID=1071382 RepID=H2AS82_KAZAF|nr:hypothetical protein KAFR_0C02390 [Kazachstania africana CBS 2517]CCF57232.1 hypothetical protein KAFR_0C02390 [Kazachstania africana CBS 2517]
MSSMEEVAPSSDFEDEQISYNSKSGDVYLAFVDAPVKESDEITIEDTFIGGEPVWLHPDSVPQKDMLRCGACKKSDEMKLLLQAFSPLDTEQMEKIQSAHGMNNLKHINPNDDRVLYVFACTNCQRKGNSIRCIRGVKQNKNESSLNYKIKNESNESKNFQINPFDLAKTDSVNPFGGDNPFGANSFGTNPFASSAKTETDNSKPVNDNTNELSVKAARKLHDLKADKRFDSKKAFKNYLLYVEVESFKNKPDHLKLPKNLKIDREALDLDNSDDIESDLMKDPIKVDPRTEKLSKFLDDDVFQKFQEIAAYNPLQVLRYDIGGKPLYYAEPKNKINLEEIVARPGFNPFSKRIFEMQLMPKMILDLEGSVSIEQGMEWGTILVFTDIENFTPSFDEHGVGYVEECVKVQWE